MCRRSQSPSLLPVLVIASSMLGRAGDERLALAPVGAQARRGRPASMRPVSPVLLHVQAEAVVLARRARAAARRRSPRPRCARSAGARRRRARRGATRLRSMLMIGVMPLPALTNSSFSGSGSGSMKSPSTPPRRTIAAGLGLRARGSGETLPSVDELGRDRDAAVGPARVGRERVRAPVVHAVDDHADPQVLAGLVARPLVAGLDDDRDGVVGLRLDPLDPPAQLARRPQRVDQLEVVVGQQRA